MPQCRRGRHKHEKRLQDPDDGAEAGCEGEISASRMTTSGRADVFPFDAFLAAWPPRRPSAPVSPSFVLNGPESALQKPQNGPICTYGPKGTLRCPQVPTHPPAPQCFPSSSRLLRSVVGGFSHAWDGQSSPSVPHWDSSARRQRPSHQDPRRVHPCPSR